MTFCDPPRVPLSSPAVLTDTGESDALRGRAAATPVLLVYGPTASGKTALALTVAERVGGEIIGADARQIYRGMPIGTATPTAAERARVPHHLIDFLDPIVPYTAGRYVADALAAIAAIHGRGNVAIVVGGTGFYLRALAGDMLLTGGRDEAIHARVEHEACIHPPDILAAWLAVLDPSRAAQLAVTDRYRTQRALEIALTRRARALHGAPSAAAAEPPPSLRSSAIPFLKVALDVDVAVLTQRITARVDAMLAAGLVAEAERIGPDAVAADAVGYREALAYAHGELTAPELRRLIIRNTRRYARRQATWLRTEPDVRRLPLAVTADARESAADTLIAWAGLEARDRPARAEAHRS